MRNTFRTKVCHVCGHQGNYQNEECRKCGTKLTDENIYHQTFEKFY